jgi:tRNA (adenine37-N6)-methyltransferase
VGWDPATSCTLNLQPIGVIRTPYSTKVEAPRQPAVAPDALGTIELNSGHNLEHAIEDIEQWQRIWVIYWFHLNEGWRPKVLPPRSTTGRKGVLSTRSPHRPNPLGLSALRLLRVDGLTLFVQGVDMLDGTPVLDIKPYVPYSDAFPETDKGWLAAPIADPGSQYTVSFSTAAQAQLDWLAARLEFPLHERIENTLTLGPQPHPYRRIKPFGDDLFQLAIKEWRADFRVSGQQVEVLQIRSGFTLHSLSSPAKSEAQSLDVHRQFHRTFPETNASLGP